MCAQVLLGNYRLQREYPTYRQDKAPHEYSNQNCTITLGEELVVEFEAQLCSYDHNFTGCDVKPRNLTVWVDDYNAVQMAIASLYQSYLSFPSNFRHKPKIVEEWNCDTGIQTWDGYLWIEFSNM